jgi:TatD DNase family protein
MRAIMFDTHCHLQDKRIFERVSGIIVNAKRAGVTNMLCCGSCVADWGDVAGIGATYVGDGVLRAYGLHPFYAGGVEPGGDGWISALEERLAGDPAAAVGEIGLDHAVSPRCDDRQAEVFARQLEIAGRHGRPVSLHCRGAFGAMLSMLKGVGGLRHGGAVHSYSGPPDLVGAFVELGCYISFSGSILIPGGKRAAAALKKTPRDRLLIETDSPDILPAGAAGPFNEPANLPLILNRVAEILGEPPRTVAELTYSNGRRLYH